MEHVINGLTIVVILLAIGLFIRLHRSITKLNISIRGVATEE